MAHHPAIAAIFAEAKKPTHCCKREAHDALQPLMAFVARTQQQVAKNRELLVVAETSDTGHDIGGDVERMHQTNGALERDAAKAMEAMRRLVQSYAQAERYYEEFEKLLSSRQ